MKDCLTLISGNEPLALGPADGQETLARATDIFRYIDSNFEHWSCDVAAPPTKEAPVQVYEMVRDSTFQEMFGGFDVKLDRPRSHPSANQAIREALSQLAEERR